MKTRKSFGLLLAVVLVTLSPSVKAQNGVEASIGADVVSQYIWRGQNLGNAAIQPTVGLSYKGLSLSAWGSTGITEASDTKEFDLTLSYATEGFHVGVTDYWFDKATNYKSGYIEDAKYFKYGAHGTTHTYEANVGYDFGILSVDWYTNFAGNDGVDKDGDRAYSSYFEISAPFKLATCDWKATVGAVPYRTDFYSKANGFAVTNVTLKATKGIKITDSFSLPLFASITANPSSQKAYFVVGLTLQP